METARMALTVTEPLRLLGTPAAGRVLAVLAGAWLTWSAVQLTWQILAPTELPLPPARTGAVNTPLTQPPLAVSVASFHLYGTPGGVISEAAPNAPDTGLALKLIGTIAGRDPLLGVALIADEAGQQGYYEPGKMVAGARVEAVYTDRVLLSVGGRQEILRMERPAGLARAADPVPDPTANAAVHIPTLDSPEVRAAIALGQNAGIGPIGPVAAQGIDLSSIRQSIVENPAELLSKVSVVPVAGAGGGLDGVRISAPGYEGVLQQAGLRADDLVVAVNGLRIDSVERGVQIAGVIRNADSITVTVRRGGREETLAPLRLR
jgi:general secretion pathway protein C